MTTEIQDPEKKEKPNVIKGSGTVQGTEKNDHITGSKRDDRIMGKPGDDEIHGKGGKDRLYGNDGNDRVFGEDGDDKVYGNAGDDYVSGGIGNDKLYGDNGRGKAGNDHLDGGAGNDTLKGGGGEDLLDGGTGNDTMYGGTEIDTFKINGHDIIEDYERGEKVIFDIPTPKDTDDKPVAKPEIKFELGVGGKLTAIFGEESSVTFDSIRMKEEQLKQAQEQGLLDVQTTDTSSTLIIKAP